MSHVARTVVVFESRPRWEPELQRQFLDEPVRVRGCRTWSELSSVAFPSIVGDGTNLMESRSSAADAIVIELPKDATMCLQWLGICTARARVPAMIVLCPAEAAELEWPLRDAGVREVLIGEVTGERLARCCQRCWSARRQHSA